MTAAIVAIRVSYKYPDGTSALDEVSFSIEAGECVGLVGPSGAGKSTLGMCIAGLAYPQKGKIVIGGVEIVRKNLAEARKKVGLIFQNPDDQLFMPTLYDDVAFGPLNQGLKGDELDLKVKKALADRGIEKLAVKFPGHLSGGQKRLASLATVLVMAPEVLILDEPSSNLDPHSRRNLIGQLGALTNTRLIAGHDLEMALDICTRVLILSGGRLIADGDPVQVLGDKSLMESNALEVPHSLLPHREMHHLARSRQK